MKVAEKKSLKQMSKAKQAAKQATKQAAKDEEAGIVKKKPAGAEANPALRRGKSSADLGGADVTAKAASTAVASKKLSRQAKRGRQAEVEDPLQTAAAAVAPSAAPRSVAASSSTAPGDAAPTGEGEPKYDDSFLRMELKDDEMEECW